MSTDIHAEFGVIGAILTQPDTIETIGLQATDFSDAACREVFSVALTMHENGTPIDVITVAEEIERNPKSVFFDKNDASVALKWLTNVQVNTPGAANVSTYAEIVRKHSGSRNLAGVGTLITELATNRSKEFGEKIAEADTLLAGLAESQRHGDLVPLNVALQDYCDSFMSREDAPPGIQTGLTAFDEISHGLMPGSFIVIGARPAMGKTSLVTGWLLNVCDHKNQAGEKTAALFLSQEMQREQILDRIISNEGSIDLERLIKANMRDDDYMRMTAAMSRLSEKHLFIDEQGALTLFDVTSKVRAAIRDAERVGAKLTVVAIDYLQLMSGKGDTRNAQLESISRGLKGLAKRHGITVIALSQLSREVEKRPNKRPIPADLRDCGSIEADADMIAFVYRDEVYNPDSQDKGVAELIVSKNRFGKTGTVRTVFSGQYTRFENMPAYGSY